MERASGLVAAHEGESDVSRRLVVRHVHDVKPGDTIVLGASVEATVIDVDTAVGIVTYDNAHVAETAGRMPYGVHTAEVLVVDRGDV